MTNRDQSAPALLQQGKAVVAAIGNLLAAIFLGGNYRYRKPGSTYY